MKFEALSQETIEEGRAHPFVQALVAVLEREQRELLMKLRDGMASLTTTADAGRVMAGRAIAVRDVLLQIRAASGGEED